MPRGFGLIDPPAGADQVPVLAQTGGVTTELSTTFIVAFIAIVAVTDSAIVERWRAVAFGTIFRP